MAERPSRLLRALGLEPQDRGVFLGIWLAGVLMYGAAELVWHLVLARFLTRVGGESMPMVFLVVSLVLLTSFLGAARGASGAGGEGRSLRLRIVLASGLVLVLAGVAGQMTPPVLFVALVLTGVYPLLQEPAFLGWISQAVPLQATKRVASGAASSAAMGRVVGAFLATDPLGLGAVEAKLGLAAGLNLVALAGLALATRAARVYGEAAPGDDAGTSEARPLGALLSQVGASELLRRVALLSFLAGFYFVLVDYPGSVTAGRAFQDEDQLTAFLGAFSMAVNLTTMLAGLFGTGRLLVGLGLGRTMRVHPAAMVLAGVVGSLAPGFYLAYALKFAALMIQRVAHSPAALLLLGAAPAGMATAARALAFGAPFAAGLLAAALLLRVTGPDLSTVYLVLAAVAGVGLVASWGVERAYLTGLLSSLEDADEVDLTEPGVAPGPATGSSAVVRALASSADPGLGLVLRRAVEGADVATLEDELAEALRLQDEEVQLAALVALERAHLGGPVAQGLQDRLLASAEGQRVARAARVAAALRDRGRVPALLAALDRCQGETRVAVATAAARLAADREALERALGALREATRHPDPDLRAAALRGLGRVGHPAFLRCLLGGLEDPHDGVVEAAAEALGRVQDPHSLGALRDLAERDEGRGGAAARSAIRRIERSTLGKVTDALEGCDARERTRLAAALGQLRGGRALGLAQRFLRVEHRKLRGLGLALVQEGDPRVLEALGSEGNGGGGRSSVDETLDCAALLDLGLTIESAKARGVLGFLDVAGRAGTPRVRALGSEAYDAAVSEHLDVAHLAALGGDAARRRVRRLAWVLGVFGEDRGARARVLTAAMGEDPRQAEAALEILETEVKGTRLGRRFLGLVGAAGRKVRGGA